jgi:MCM OB domain
LYSNGSLISLRILLYKNQHEENQNRNAAPANVPVRRDMPAGLLRRYEVNIIPFFNERARKIREIKAVGSECILQSLILPKFLTDNSYQISWTAILSVRLDIGKLVKLKGMVTRASDVKPHVTVCTYTCDTCGSEIYQEIVGAQFTPIFNCPSQRCIDNKSA